MTLVKKPRGRKVTSEELSTALADLMIKTAQKQAAERGAMVVQPDTLATVVSTLMAALVDKEGTTIVLEGGRRRRVSRAQVKRAAEILQDRLMFRFMLDGLGHAASALTQR